MGLHYDIENCMPQPHALIYEPTPRTPGRTRGDRRLLRRRGIRLQNDLILTTSTSSTAFLFRLLCEPGDTVLVPTPSYPLFDFLADLRE